jgi:hypothetical protein
LIPFRPTLPYNPATLMPLESEYADDADFLDDDPLKLQFIQAVASQVLKQWNLNINTTKTEFVDFHLAQKNEDDFENEEWRKSKLLGSHMCSIYDIKQRCIKGNIAFNSYKNVWLQGRRINIRRLIQIYEAMVVSVIMYNCSSWAATKDILEKLDVCHRNHLRQILNIRYPTVISNKKLYEICQTKPLSQRVKLARWRLFGHILRMPENSPAALSLYFAVAGCQDLKGRRGRHRMNLLNILGSDINRIPIDRSSTNIHRHTKLKLKTDHDISTLRELAHNRREWENLFIYLV